MAEERPLLDPRPGGDLWPSEDEPRPRSSWIAKGDLWGREAAEDEVAMPPIPPIVPSMLA